MPVVVLCISSLVKCLFSLWPFKNIGLFVFFIIEWQ